MKKLSTIIIILGVVIALSPVAGRLYAQYKENKMIIEWLQSSDDFYDELDMDADPEEAYAQLQDALDTRGGRHTQTGAETGPNELAGNEEGNQQSGTGTRQTTAKKTKTPVKQTVLGVIVIDKIKVKYPIVEGIKEVNLLAGIGHIPGTALPGQPGNSALAGHRNYTFGRFFNRLDEIEEGDKISISTKEGDFRYIVYDKFVVTPDDVSVLEKTEDDNIITLVTCTPIYIASHRLIVRARLESQTALDP